VVLFKKDEQEKANKVLHGSLRFCTDDRGNETARNASNRESGQVSGGQGGKGKGGGPASIQL